MIRITPTHWFAGSSEQALDSLFQAGGTASGWCKRHSNRIIFYDQQDKPRVALIRKGPDHWLVSCSETDTGQIWYMHACMDMDESFIGIHGMGYLAKRDLAKHIWNHNAVAV